MNSRAMITHRQRFKVTHIADSEERFTKLLGDIGEDEIILWLGTDQSIWLGYNEGSLKVIKSFNISTLIMNPPEIILSSLARNLRS